MFFVIYIWFLGEAYFVPHFFLFFLYKNVLCIIFIIIFERSTGHND